MKLHDYYARESFEWVSVHKYDQQGGSYVWDQLKSSMAFL